VLKINDVFWTFQGEGYLWGKRALFVRMPYCNLKCSWCDTEFNSHTDWTEESFKNIALSEPSRFAVITGGEPMMNKQTPHIVKKLNDLGFFIACETNGTFPIVEGIDFVTISPKRDSNYQINKDAILKCSELKLVVDEGFDLNIAKQMESLFKSTNTRLSLSPEYNKMNESFKVIEKYIKENPRWNLSLQTHKFLDIK
jgi:7-carboxy-7-deazaguanine synthase